MFSKYRPIRRLKNSKHFYLQITGYSLLQINVWTKFHLMCIIEYAKWGGSCSQKGGCHTVHVFTPSLLASLSAIHSQFVRNTKVTDVSFTYLTKRSTGLVNN